MTDPDNTLTTSEYAKLAGLSVSTIGKMLRNGKLQGRKINGKWAIDSTEAQKIKTATNEPNEIGLKDTPSGVDPTSTAVVASDATPYDLDTFTQMTYLTEQGVRQWLKDGRLSGNIDTHGNVWINADNLNRPEIRHLIRK